MSRNGPNRVAFYAQRRWEVVSSEEFGPTNGGWAAAEARFEQLQATKGPGQVVRKTCRHFGSRQNPTRYHTVTVYQR